MQPISPFISTAEMIKFHN